MDFIDIIGKLDHEDILQQIYAKTSTDVEAALSKEKCSLHDFLALISPAAAPYLEYMAQESRRRTQKRFGKTIQMYVPLYLSNYCTNHCVYCGFNHSNDITRTILSADDIRNEAETIRSLGFGHILLVTGESPKCGASYLNDAIKLIRPLFSQISIEVQPLKQDEYEMLIVSGLHAVYLYQETYNATKYKDYHPRGLKANYAHRIDTVEQMGRAGIHKMGLGVLLGLDDWRIDSFYLAMHLDYLRKRYWKTKYSVSFPRLRPHAGSFNPPFHATERDLLQLIFAYRIFDTDLELALSTRESPRFRDNAMQLGITSMSAGSHTEPGGYAADNGALKQFEPNDNRSPEQVMEMIKSQGYETVWKDWDAYMQLV
ncbi:MAG TPA: 2-iminoacetate synthase ThiH [Bacteroidales bacterium]|nr:2-iminoacetate synthase ThiH [Bacteroidales bacterium]